MLALNKYCDRKQFPLIVGLSSKKTRMLVMIPNGMLYYRYRYSESDESLNNKTLITIKEK